MTSNNERRFSEWERSFGHSCGWWVGPVWKLDGETCVCTEPDDHAMPHKCSCGAWFEGCGHPPTQRRATE